MTVDHAIIENYTSFGLYDRILGVFGQEDVDVKALSDVDNLHIGGQSATSHLIRAMNLSPGAKVLEVGAGIGGPARQVASEADVHVTGIDLTPEFCDIATRLSQITKMQDRVSFQTGNALSMPFAHGGFDAAYTIHTAMNIEHKLDLYNEIFRVLKPGGVFGIYDIMYGDDPRELDFPLPWSATPETSFLVTMNDTIMFLQSCGFNVVSKEDRRRFAMDALRRGRAEKPIENPAENLAGGAPPKGEDFGLRVANLAAAVADSRCTLWQVLCRKPG